MKLYSFLLVTNSDLPKSSDIVSISFSDYLAIMKLNVFLYVACLKLVKLFVLFSDVPKNDEIILVSFSDLPKNYEIMLVS